MSRWDKEIVPDIVVEECLAKKKAAERAELERLLTEFQKKRKIKKIKRGKSGVSSADAVRDWAYLGGRLS